MKNTNFSVEINLFNRKNSTFKNTVDLLEKPFLCCEGGGCAEYLFITLSVANQRVKAKFELIANKEIRYQKS